MKYFNTEGVCRPDEHYMVRLDGRLEQIKRSLVDQKKYFVINKGRQYGKTTILNALEKYLQDEYMVIAMDFQLMGSGDFADEASFVKAFAGMVSGGCPYGLIRSDTMLSGSWEEMLGPLKDMIVKYEYNSLNELFIRLSRMCAAADRPVVLMIDEIDSAFNHQVFIDFLAQLRGYYLKRDKISIFHSVILAGVYDIKNLKLKLRPEAEHQYNSPWNIAEKFKIDLNFEPNEIAQMLQDYEMDYHIGMDINEAADEIYAYTSGYPVLVSSICKCMDEELTDKDSAWSKAGVEKAVTVILKENPPLFESMVKQLDTYPELRSMIEDIIYRGKRIPFSLEEKSIKLGVMFGFLKEQNNHVAVANRMFEMCLLNMFLAKEAITSEVDCSL